MLHTPSVSLLSWPDLECMLKQNAACSSESWMKPPTRPLTCRLYAQSHYHPYDTSGTKVPCDASIHRNANAMPLSMPPSHVTRSQTPSVVRVIRRQRTCSLRVERNSSMNGRRIPTTISISEWMWWIRAAPKNDIQEDIGKGFRRALRVGGCKPS